LKFYFPTKQKKPFLLEITYLDNTFFFFLFHVNLK